MPDKGNEYPHPVACKLHEGELKEIKAEVKAISSKIDKLSGPEGIIWNMHEEITVVRGAAQRAHERIDDSMIEIRATEIAHKELATEVSTMGRKIAGIASIPGLITLIILLIGWAMR